MLEDLGSCQCSLAPASLDGDEVLRAFAQLRKDCPALRTLVPDDLWPSFEAWDRVADRDAYHRSICVLALQRGHIRQITEPIHRYLLEGGGLQPNVQEQYIRDLQERWMLASAPLERHRQSRIFMGRIVELQCAAWLESAGWEVTGLAALGDGPDILARKEHQRIAFEVKAIGTQDAAFMSVLASLHNEPSGRSCSPDAAVNYLLFRTYEAAKQLHSEGEGRVAIVVIDQMAWHEFNRQLFDRWIDWNSPRFFGGDPEWTAFIDAQRGRYEQLDDEMGTVIHSLDALWIARRSEGFMYRLELAVALRSRQIHT